MWLLLVTSIASVVLAENGYQYNAPNVPFRLPNNQQANNYQSYNSQRYNYNMNDEFSSNAINKGYVMAHLNNQYAGYNQPFTPLMPFNNNYAQANFQHAPSPVGVGSNIGYNQPPLLPSNSHHNLNNGASYTNSYTQLPSISLNPPKYAQALTGPLNNNYNNGHSYAPPVYTGQQNQPQPFTPIGTNNLNSNVANTVNNVGAYNNGYDQHRIQASGAFGNSYNSQSYNNNVYSHSSNSAAGTNVHFGLGHSFTPAPSNSNNGYTENGPLSARNQLNVANGQSSNQAAGVTVNNVFQQSYTEQSSSNIKTDYEQRITTSGVNNNGFVANQTPNSNGGSNNGYSQSSSGPTHIDLNSDLVVHTSNNINSGVIQKSVDRGANIIPATTGSNSKVTPIIHKHIYFHVPPPEIEDTAKQVSPPQVPKKNYKILFIKMPSQESKSNLIRLQEQMRNAAVEDRTLIYVLVKKPEESKPVVLSKPKPSDHQVFFVKYNDSPFDIAARVSDEIDKTGSINSIVPLEPGLVNGRQN